MFKTDQGVTHGGPVSPTIFNIVSCEVVRATLLKVCVPQEAQHRLVWAEGIRTYYFALMVAALCGEILYDFRGRW